MRAFKKLVNRLLSSVAMPVGIIVGSFYIFNSLGSIHYLAATVLAFGIGFFAIYLVFKYWINVDIANDTPEQQLTRSAVVFIVNLAIFTQLVYFLVTYAYMPLLTAQAVAAVVVAYESFYAYRSLVFRMGKKRKTVAQVLGRASINNPERL